MACSPNDYMRLLGLVESSVIISIPTQSTTSAIHRDRSVGGAAAPFISVTDIFRLLSRLCSVVRCEITPYQIVLYKNILV